MAVATQGEAPRLPDRSPTQVDRPDPRMRRRVGQFARDGLFVGLIAAAVNAAVVVLATATGHRPLVDPGEPWSTSPVPLSPVAAAGATLLAGVLAGVLAGITARIMRRPAPTIALGGTVLTAVSLIAPLQTSNADGRAALVACHLIAGTAITAALVRDARRRPGR